MSKPVSLEPRFDSFWLWKKRFFVLRDDLIGGEFNGNKARKLHYLLKAELKGIVGIVSCGSALSNAMYSLSVFAKMRNLEFDYFISHIAPNLLECEVGNLAAAVKNGMRLHIALEREALARDFASSLGGRLFIPEGVASPLASAGFKEQAKEIASFCAKNSLCPDIFLPSGTGASAAFLAKHLADMGLGLKIFTCACVGDSQYLKQQITALLGYVPLNLHILNPPKKYHFAKPKPELYAIWQEVNRASGIEFELIYDPVGFLSIFTNLQLLKQDILYIHQGGLLGNLTQLKRYLKNK